MRLAVAGFAALFLCAATATAATPVQEVRQYRKSLQTLDSQLQRMESARQRPLKALLQKHSSDLQVRLPGGDTIPVGGAQFERLSSRQTASSTVEEVRAARRVVAHRLRSLNQMLRSDRGQQMQTAGAPAVIHSLAAEGQIRTGPTQLEQVWFNIRTAVARTLGNILGWIGKRLFGSLPSGAADINSNFVWAFFFLTTYALILLLCYLLWRTLHGSWGRRGAAREVRLATSPDEELLQLSPEELRRRAMQLAAEGNHREALRHLYLGLLLQLEKAGVWRYNPRGTNWEHIDRLRRQPAAASLVAPLCDITRAFDRVRYGNAPCTEGDWIRFEGAVAALNTAATADPAASDSAPAPK